MKFVFLIVIALPLIAQAQYNGPGTRGDRYRGQRPDGNPPQSDRAIREQRLLNVMEDTRGTVSYNIQKMSDQDLQHAEELLQKVSEVAQGVIISNQPPVQVPIPVPQILFCDQELDVSLNQKTFIKIKTFAYNGDGLNYDSQQAINYAQQWMSKHPCERADSYITDLKRLKKFAYDGTGLNYDQLQAVSYGLSKIDRFCSQFKIEAVFKQHYDFAYSGNGLNYDSNQARNYASGKIEALAFNCNNL